MARRLKKRSTRAMFRFKPFSARQKKVLTWWMHESPVHDMSGIIADGAVRSGKTVSMALSYVIWAMDQFHDENFAMCGKTILSFRRNVLSFLTLMLWARGYGTSYNRSDNLLTITRCGTENHFWIFGGKDERSQDLIQGITLAGVFLDEVALMPESFVQQATARCSVDGSKYWMNCNPEGPAHWFKREWINKANEKNLAYLHFTMDDNLSLSDKIKERYRAMYTGVFHRRFILGEWAIAEGVIYDNFDPERHLVEIDADTKRDKRFGKYISIDYGTQNATVFLMWERIGDKVKSKWICTKEYYHSGRDSGNQKTDSEYADDLAEFIGAKSDDCYEEEEYVDVGVDCVVVDPSAASFIAELKQRGYVIKHANNAVLDGIRLTRSLLSMDEIAFDRSCTHLTEEMGMYSWDDKAAQRGEDAPVKENDHCSDALRYMVYTIIRRERKWRDMNEYHRADI